MRDAINAEKALSALSLLINILCCIIGTYLKILLLHVSKFDLIIYLKNEILFILTIFSKLEQHYQWPTYQLSTDHEADINNFANAEL